MHQYYFANGGFTAQHGATADEKISPYILAKPWAGSETASVATVGAKSRHSAATLWEINDFQNAGEFSRCAHCGYALNATIAFTQCLTVALVFVDLHSPEIGPVVVHLPIQKKCVHDATSDDDDLTLTLRTLVAASSQDARRRLLRSSTDTSSR